MISRSTLLRTLVLASASAMLAALPATAQTSALGGIGGTVRDSSGAVVSGATVTIIDLQTGAKRTVTADSEGHYSAEFLQPGNYEVMVAAGSTFGQLDRKNIPVTVGAPVTVDAVLPAASVSTEVTVTTEQPLVDTEKVEASQVVDQQIVSNVPVNSRRFESFVLLTPNVVPDGTTGLIAYRGVNGTYNQNIVDGANNNQQFFSEARGRSIGAPYVFPVDAINEFESSATGYSAELGGAAGGIINAITKSGGNQWHGDAYEYYRTPGWNALDPLNKYNGRLTNNAFLLTQPVKVQNEFGISAGGPIQRDKLFFHFTYDGYRKITPITYLSSYNSTTTSVANLIHLCDGGTTPVTETSTSGGKTTTTTFPTTIPGVSATQCAAAVKAIQANLGSFPRNLKQDIFFPRLDYQMGRTHISAEFLWQDFHQPNGYNTSITVLNGGQSQNGTADFHERILIANAETALSARTANAIHFQWGRDLETDTTNFGGPANNLGSLVSYGETSALPRGKFPDEHKWQISDVYSLTSGHHTTKAGFDAYFVHEQIANLFGGNGSFTYNNSFVEANFTNWIQDQLGINPTTVVGGAAGTPRHYASFSQTVDQLTGVGADDFWNQNLDFFVEDQWKATPRFLLSLGLRYDVQLVPGPDMPNTLNAAAFKATSQINPDFHMIQPRFGFNWNPYEGTVVRGGYGMFYGQVGNSSYYTLRRENGVYQKQYGVSASLANAPYTTCATGTACTVAYQNNGVYQTYSPQGGVPIYTPPGPAPVYVVTGQPVTIPSSINPSLAQGITIRGMDPTFTNPVSHSWDLTVEQAMPLKTTFSLAYVGNRANHLPVYVDTNVDPASVLTNRFYVYTNPLTGVVSNQVQPTYVNKLYASTGTVATGFSAVNSWYHSMVVTVRKPMAHGVELLANYTWAKAMDNGQTYGGNGTFNGTDAPLVPFFTGGRTGVGDEYSRSDLDVRSRLVVTLVGKSDFKLGNRYLEYVTNGWLLGGTYTAQSGEPVTATINGSITGISGGALGTPGLAITTDAGVTNAAFTSGPSARVPDWIASRNAFKGPGIHNLDARLSRNFAVFERYHFEVAAEAFNLANHRNILSVNTALVAYSAPGSSSCPATLASGNNGCLGPLSTSSAQFMTPSSTSNIIYGPRQLQLLGRFIF